MSTNTVRSNTVSPLRQRMIEDMKAHKLGAQSQKSHIMHKSRNLQSEHSEPAFASQANNLERSVRISRLPAGLLLA